jgi:hypothetical protein
MSEGDKACVDSAERESRPRLREAGELGEYDVVVSAEDVAFAAALRTCAAHAAERMAVEANASERAPARLSAQAVQAMAARAVPSGPEAGLLKIPLAFVDRMARLDARDLEVVTDAGDRWTASVLVKINADQVPGYREAAMLESGLLRAAIAKHERGRPIDSSDRYLARRNLVARLEEAERTSRGDGSDPRRMIELRSVTARRAGAELPFDLVRRLAQADARDLARIAERVDLEAARGTLVGNAQEIRGYWSFLRGLPEIWEVFGVVANRDRNAVDIS